MVKKKLYKRLNPPTTSRNPEADLLWIHIIDLAQGEVNVTPGWSIAAGLSERSQLCCRNSMEYHGIAWNTMEYRGAVADSTPFHNW